MNLQDMHTFIHRYCGKRTALETTYRPARLAACGPRAMSSMPLAWEPMTGVGPPVRMLVPDHLFMNKVDECCAATKFIDIRIVELPSPNHCRGSAHRQVRWPGRHPFSTRAQWIFAYRSCQIDLPEFWPGERKRRGLSSPLRRYQPHQGRRRVRGFDQIRGP